MTERKFKVGDKVRTLKCETINGFKRFKVGTIGIVDMINDKNSSRYRVKLGDINKAWYDEDELELVEDTNADTVTKKDFDHKFKVGDIVVVGDSIIGKITDINMRNYTYEVILYTNDIGWFDENELKIFDCAICESQNKVVEKLEEELRRKDSELRDLKELIIKLLFDRYGV